MSYPGAILSNRGKKLTVFLLSRYNLKRRVASLPPISSEVFTEKVLQARAVSTAEADKAGFERVCDVCQKTYFSENSYRNHIGSAKHRARATALPSQASGAADDASSVMSSTFSLGDPVDAKPDVGSDAEEEFTEVIESLKKAGLNDRTSPIKRPSNPHLSAASQQKTEHPVSQSSGEQPSNLATSASSTPTPSKAGGPVLSLKSCLFCNYDSPTVPLNAHHMERIHGMFIPEKEYLVDLEGLLSTLQQRVFEMHECLSCGKVKANSDAAQTHMRDTGHCKIPYTTEDEQLDIGEFYDFRGTYSDSGDSDDESADGDNRQHGGAKLGAKRQAKVAGGDGDEVKDEEDGWETDSSASSLDTEDLHAVPAEQHYHQYERLGKHPHHSHDDPRNHHQRDGWHSHAHKHTHAAFYDEYEMHLPSGKSVGHRSLNKYYRQNLHSYPSAEERAERQAIEAAEAGDDMDMDGEDGEGGEGGQVARRDRPGRGRALVSRANGGLGMAGVSAQKKREVRRAEARSRKVQDISTRATQWSVNKQANAQKYFHYSIL